MSAPTAGDFLEALRTQLIARLAAAPAFADVEVHLIRPDLPQVEAIVLVRDRISETFEYATATDRARENVVRIPGLVRAYSTGSTAFQDAIDRAAAIVGEVADELRDAAPAVGVQTRSATVTATSWLPMLSDKGGVLVDGEFEITYSARVT